MVESIKTAADEGEAGLEGGDLEAPPHASGYGQAKTEEGFHRGGDASLVDFDGPSDLYNPQNWPFHKKVYTTMLWALTTCWITFASAIYSAGILQISEEFQVTTEVANAGTALLIFGFAIGPMVWAPLCEVYGRKWAALAVGISCHFLRSRSSPAPC